MALLDLGRSRGHTSTFADQIRHRLVTVFGAIAEEAMAEEFYRSLP